MRRSIVSDYQAKYLKALLKGSEAKASTVITNALRNEVSPFDIYMRILLPSERELGTLWMEGKISIAQEHLGTEITLQQMNRLRPVLRPRERHGHRCVVSSIEGDMHYMGARVAADFLYCDGWEVDFLGASIPVRDLVQHLSEKTASLLVISVMLEDYIPNFESLISRVRASKKRLPKIIVGGAGISTKKQALELGADGYAADPLEVMSVARDLCGLSAPYPSLEQILARMGARIREARRLREMSQQELANEAGLDRAYISGLENGKQNVTLGAVVKISCALDVNFEELLFSKEVPVSTLEVA